MPLLAFCALAALVLDQLSKIWIRATLPPGGRIEVWPEVFHLQHVTNLGAAWGIFHGQRWGLVLFSLLVVVGVLSWAREAIIMGRIATVGLGLILGGALGNMVDRILFGGVTDFFDLDTPVEVLRTFPVFNVADSCLTVGVILLCGVLIFGRGPEVGATAPTGGESSSQ